MGLEIIIVILLLCIGFASMLFFQKRMYDTRKTTDIAAVVDQVFGMSAQKIAEQSRAILSSEKETIKTDLANKQVMMEKLVVQLREDMNARQEEIRKLEQDRIHTFSKIVQSLDQQRELTSDLKISTDQLAKVLSNNQERGAWGERIIEDLLLANGLMEGIHYKRQSKLGESTLKPDITLLLPNQRVVAVDVKFPYSEMQKLAEAETKAAQAGHLKQFETDLKTKIDKVATYIDPSLNTLDYAILFVPNEMVFSFINQKLPALIDRALSKRVLLVSPFTFLIVARTVMESYRNFMIGDRLKEVITHIDAFTTEWEKFRESFAKYGRSLKTLQMSFDELTGTRFRQMEKRLEKVKTHTTAALAADEKKTLP